MADFIVSMINLLIKGLGTVLNFVFSILPTSPFLLLESLNIPFLSELNWVIPISSIVGIVGYWLAAIAIYYIVSVVLRWIKAIN